MQVTETASEGLRREYKVVVPAQELDAKVGERLNELKDRVRINGFRPGKVPVAHLRRVYGRAAMAEVIEAAIRENNSKIVGDNKLRLAMEPKVTLPTDEAEVENLISGKSDLAYTVAMEILAPIELADFRTIELTKLVTDIGDKDIDEALERIAKQNRPYSDKGEGAKAEQDDRVTISFVGKIDGTPFEGGSGEDIAVQIGSGSFIPGFEEQLIGIAAGESRVLKVSFPENYLNAELAGKAAEFDVTAKSIEAPREVTTDDEFAKSLGMESLEKLKDAVREQIKREYDGVSRQRLKRALLDALDERHRFELPQTLVEQEFEGLWKSTLEQMKSENRTFADEKTTEEEAKADYRKIADRRVRLGLVLAEIGEKNAIKVTDEEVTRAIVEQTRQMPGREQQVWDYYRSNPNALASLRAPIFEEKVVDFILALAKVTEKPVSREDLYKVDEDAPAA
ncbi:MAG: trigger factor [Pseudorhodoplanes sp.]|nr:Trigger factor [Pseudorhodoplanes sp.]MBW7950506.1 trigger factor [Pseudorhodoplanes sp.]MCL4712683.1 trigger factor [Pseudorhodoplanes sp.]